ncbi:MAG: hypothetical protein HFI31_05230, partial [Lachnospiraceae bacterium]|nr:hypothetical protein [Lachnospiraceae bacterium]
MKRGKEKRRMTGRKGLAGIAVLLCLWGSMGDWKFLDVYASEENGERVQEQEQGQEQQEQEQQEQE